MRIQVSNESVLRPNYSSVSGQIRYSRAVSAPLWGDAGQRLWQKGTQNSRPQDPHPPPAAVPDFGTGRSRPGTHLPQQLQVPLLDLVQLNDAGAPCEVAHGHKFGAAGHPLTVKHRVIEALLDMGDDLRLLKGRHGPAERFRLRQAGHSQQTLTKQTWKPESKRYGQFVPPACRRRPQKPNKQFQVSQIMPDALVQAHKSFLPQQHKLVYGFTQYLSYRYRLWVIKRADCERWGQRANLRIRHILGQPFLLTNKHAETPALGPPHGTSQERGRSPGAGWRRLGGLRGAPARYSLARVEAGS